MNPGQKLVKANDDYHEAVGEILLDEDLPLKLKVELSCEAEKVFAAMTRANDIIAAFYGVG
jgi:hypothetical protein